MGKKNMAIFREYLENSTVHGLVYIATTKSFVRLIWIFIVFIAVVYEFTLIVDSFKNWSQNPVSTTIETYPIGHAPFPSGNFFSKS